MHYHHSSHEPRESRVPFCPGVSFRVPIPRSRKAISASMDLFSKLPDPPIMSVQVAMRRDFVSQRSSAPVTTSESIPYPYEWASEVDPVISSCPESTPAHEPASESTPAPELSPKPSPVPELNTLILHFLQFGHYIDPRIKKETKEEEGVLSYIPWWDLKSDGSGVSSSGVLYLVSQRNFGGAGYSSRAMEADPSSFVKATEAGQSSLVSAIKDVLGSQVSAIEAVLPSRALMAALELCFLSVLSAVARPSSGQQVCQFSRWYLFC